MQLELGRYSCISQRCLPTIIKELVQLDLFLEVFDDVYQRFDLALEAIDLPGHALSTSGEDLFVSLVRTGCHVRLARLGFLILSLEWLLLVVTGVVIVHRWCRVERILVELAWLRDLVIW